MRATGLGRDPVTGCISASDEWWTEQNMAMLGCISFKSIVLEHEDMMRIMFDVINVTNDTLYVPGSGHDDAEAKEHEARHGDGDSERVEGTGSPEVTPNANKRPAQGFPYGKKKKTYRDQLMKRLVDTYEKKAQSSKNSATSHVFDLVRDEIGAMLGQVIDDGAEEGSDEHYYATQLLKKKENRDVFITLKTPNGRLNWLRRAWEDRNN
ncbi:hypothetical protein BDA96_09G007000 [Sorghum bicolor]|uniref:Uncharacterized protein n=2 Tax=Sorghum bicolor TaxID=4558 RepID=A0A921Q7C2_SORBI|nr:hypothetical protein BDA96_09G007000 [Sorghum bicolor]KXG21045.2 hypothetical protein SORBI_3009G006800 [Sorghum bicolor]